MKRSLAGIVSIVGVLAFFSCRGAGTGARLKRTGVAPPGAADTRNEHGHDG